MLRLKTKILILFCGIGLVLPVYFIHGNSSMYGGALDNIKSWTNLNIMLRKDSGDGSISTIRDGRQNKFHNADMYENGFTNQEDENFIGFIQEKWLLGPSDQPYNLTKDVGIDHSFSQAEPISLLVDQLYRNKTHGTFIECGAYDGERWSNTLYLERRRQWTGILIEPNPTQFQKLKYKHRKSQIINTCLSPSVKSEKLQLLNAMGWYSGIDGHVMMHDRLKKKAQLYEVQCFPLYSILKASHLPSIDYFSLDVEGADLDVLKTIPFDKVDISLIGVEYAHYDGVNKPDKAKGEARLEEIRAFFKMWQQYEEWRVFHLDVLFIKTDVLNKLSRT